MHEVIPSPLHLSCALISLTGYSFTRLYTHSSMPVLSCNFFWTGPDSKYFGLVGPPRSLLELLNSVFVLANIKTKERMWVSMKLCVPRWAAGWVWPRAAAC